MIEYCELREAAKAASPGPWTLMVQELPAPPAHQSIETPHGCTYDTYRAIIDAKGETITDDATHYPVEAQPNDMAYIALANPEVVLGLIERCAAAEQKLRDIRAGHTKTVEYDLSPAMVESALRDKLVELGWTPPDTFTQEDSELLEEFAHNNDMRCGSPTESDHLRDLAKRIQPAPK